jgi:hypothetical protein
MATRFLYLTRHGEASKATSPATRELRWTGFPPELGV